MPSSRIMGSSPFRQLLTTRDTPMRKPATGEPVRETARTFRRAGCALKAHETMSPGMATAVEPSRQPRTESCVVSGNGPCEA